MDPLSLLFVLRSSSNLTADSGYYSNYDYTCRKQTSQEKGQPICVGVGSFRPFRGADKKPIQNLELWKSLIELCETHNVTCHKVKGHADNELNNLCDKLATTEIAKNQSKND